MPPRLLRIISRQQPIQLIIPPLRLILFPIIIEIKRQALPPPLLPSMMRPPLVIISRAGDGGEAGLAGGFEACVYGGDAGRDIFLGEGEERGLGG